MEILLRAVGDWVFLQRVNLTVLIILMEKLVINLMSNLTNLTHLRLVITAYSCQCLLGWITLLEASPLLQKFTLELTCYRFDRETRLEKRTSFTLSLKQGWFVGLPVDLELITYMIENAVAIEEVIIELMGYGSAQYRIPEARAEAKALKEKLPPGAKLVISYGNRLDDIF